MTTPRICVVGAGGWSTRMHLPAMKRVQAAGTAEYAGVCDLDQGKADRYAAALDAPAYTALETMVSDAGPDGLVLIVNVSATPTLISKAIGMGIPFLCEKPPATDTDTHRRLLAAAGDLPHIVAYNRRHAPYTQRAKAWVASEAIQTVTALFSRRRRREEDFSTTAIHAIDTTLYLAGGDLASTRVEIVRAGEVRNYFVSGWTRQNARFDIIVTPDTSTQEEHYVVRGLNRSARIAFPHPSMFDFPGHVQLHEEAVPVTVMTHCDFGLKPDDAPALAGMLAEHERFAGMLAGEAESISTLQTSLQTQLIREPLQQPGDRVVANGEAAPSGAFNGQTQRP